MAPAADKRLSGRKVAAVACFDSFGKVAMTLLAASKIGLSKPPAWRVTRQVARKLQQLQYHDRHLLSLVLF